MFFGCYGKTSGKNLIPHLYLELVLTDSWQDIVGKELLLLVGCGMGCSDVKSFSLLIFCRERSPSPLRVQMPSRDGALGISQLIKVSRKYSIELASLSHPGQSREWWEVRNCVRYKKRREIPSDSGRRQNGERTVISRELFAASHIVAAARRQGSSESTAC